MKSRKRPTRLYSLPDDAPTYETCQEATAEEAVAFERHGEPRLYVEDGERGGMTISNLRPATRADAREFIAHQQKGKRGR